MDIGREIAIAKDNLFRLIAMRESGVAYVELRMLHKTGDQTTTVFGEPPPHKPRNCIWP